MIPYGILLPTDDMDAAAKFFAEVVGLKQKFRDGDRYCAFEFGALTLALAGGEERIAPAMATIYRVEDVAAALAAMTAKGAKVTRPAERGPHEERAVVLLPGGGYAVLSAKLT